MWVPIIDLLARHYKISYNAVATKVLHNPVEIDNLLKEWATCYKASFKGEFDYPYFFPDCEWRQPAYVGLSQMNAMQEVVDGFTVYAWHEALHTPPLVYPELPCIIGKWEDNNEEIVMFPFEEVFVNPDLLTVIGLSMSEVGLY
jgi:hypothetical protein